MRILQISSARTYGGGERHVVDLCSGLHERGHEIFVALRPTNEWQDRLAFIAADHFIHVSIRNSFGMFSAKRIGRFLTENAIDIVHAHVARDYIAASVAGRMSKKAHFVLTRHVMFPLKPFHRFALRNVDAAIAVSPAVAGQLRQVFPDRKVHTIYNGLAINDRPDAEQLGNEFRSFHDIPLDVPLIGTLGELRPLKGQRDFVLAANEIAKQNADCRFVVAGTDNSPGQAFRRELRRLTKVLGLDDKFVWLDWLDDTAPFYAAIDVFVSPSHSESFGLAILEAMARGTAVVATDTDGARELLADPALLVPIGDPVAMADALAAMLADPDGRTETASCLRDRAHSLYSADRMVDATEELYASVKGF